VINFPIRNALGHRLASIASDFDPCTYGYRKLSDLVRKTGAFEVDQSEGGGLRIRPKLQAAKTASIKPVRRSYER
jgi:hypothetical protein